jgi:hypothetical protein
MQSLETITLNDAVYVRADSMPKPAVLDGLNYAIVRSKDQGVMCGFVKSIEGRRVTLLHARQMWRWSSRFILPDVAEFGLTHKFDRKFSTEMSQPVEMLEACGVLYCSDPAMRSLRAEPSQEPGK